MHCTQPALAAYRNLYSSLRSSVRSPCLLFQFLQCGSFEQGASFADSFEKDVGLRSLGVLLAGGDSDAWWSDSDFARGAGPARGPGADLAAAGSAAAVSGDRGARGRAADLAAAWSAAAGSGDRGAAAGFAVAAGPRGRGAEPGAVAPPAVPGGRRVVLAFGRVCGVDPEARPPPTVPGARGGGEAGEGTLFA